MKTAAYLQSGRTDFSERKQLAKLAKRPADTTWRRALQCLDRIFCFYYQGITLLRNASKILSDSKASYSTISQFLYRGFPWSILKMRGCDVIKAVCKTAKFGSSDHDITHTHTHVYIPSTAPDLPSPHLLPIKSIDPLRWLHSLWHVNTTNSLINFSGG